MDQPNGEAPKISEEQAKKIEKEMNQLLSLTLTKREWIIIFNIMNSMDYKLGDARELLKTTDKIQSIIAVETNIKRPVIVNKGAN